MYVKFGEGGIKFSCGRATNRNSWADSYAPTKNYKSNKLETTWNFDMNG